MKIHDQLDTFLGMIRPEATIVGVDLSKRRIGLATTAIQHGIVTPRQTYHRRSWPKDVEFMTKFLRDHEASALIVGFPLLKSGTIGPQAQSIRDMAQIFCARLSIPGWMQDESFSTAEAHERSQQETGSGRHKTNDIDHLAAAIILEDFCAQVKRRRATDLPDQRN